MIKTEVTSKESIRKRKKRYRRIKNSPRMENTMTVEEYYKKKEQKIANFVNNLIGDIREDNITTDQQKLSFCKYARELLADFQKEIETKIAPPLPNPSDDYPRYPGPHEDALKWLETHWGKYLKFFGAEKDCLFQDQLRKLDQKLMVAITCGKYKKIIESTGKMIRDIIPRKSERITEEINFLCVERKKSDIIRTSNAISQRENRNNQKIINEKAAP